MAQKTHPKKGTAAKTLGASKASRKSASATAPSSDESVPLTEQSKVRISLKNSGSFRENQRAQSQPRNTVNPASRR